MTPTVIEIWNGKTGLSMYNIHLPLYIESPVLPHLNCKSFILSINIDILMIIIGNRELTSAHLLKRVFSMFFISNILRSLVLLIKVLL